MALLGGTVLVAEPERHEAAEEAGPPLTEAQYDEVRQAVRARRRVKGAARTALLSGAITLAIGVLAAPFVAVWPSASGALIVLGVSAAGAVELVASQRMRRAEPSAARLLGANQLALLGVVALYCVIQMAAFSPEEVRAAALSPEVQAQLSAVPEMARSINDAIMRLGVERLAPERQVVDLARPVDAHLKRRGGVHEVPGDALARGGAVRIQHPVSVVPDAGGLVVRHDHEHPVVEEGPLGHHAARREGLGSEADVEGVEVEVPDPKRSRVGGAGAVFDDKVAVALEFVVGMEPEGKAHGARAVGCAIAEVDVVAWCQAQDRPAGGVCGVGRAPMFGAVTAADLICGGSVERPVRDQWSGLSRCGQPTEHHRRRQQCQHVASHGFLLSGGHLAPEGEDAFRARA